MISRGPILCLCGILWAFCSTSYASPTDLINWLNCTQNVPDVSGTLDLTAVNLSNLPSELHCGQLTVPMNYEKALSADNNITLGLAMYRPTNPKGVIFYNGGGSDANAVVAWLVALNQTDTFSDLLHYDLMFLDTRGTYSSNPLNISTAGFDAVDAILGPLPTTEEEFNATRSYSSAFIQSWIDSSTPPGIIEYVGTKEVVQDFEQIRKALGYEKINFIGSSYGSYRAAQYAASFPRHVGNFVLDAVIPHGRSSFDRVQDSIAALNRGILRADAYCQNNSSCPWHSNGTGIIPTIVRDILASAAQAPLPVSTCLLTTPCDANSTVTDIKQDILAYLAQPDYPQIFEALEGALNGDGSGFPGGPQSNVEAIVSIPMECGDYDFQSTTFDQWEQALNTAIANDPSEINYLLEYQIQLACLGWPFKSSVDKPLTINHPMLLVTADFDPLAPMEWAIFAWETAASSSLVIRHGDDHTSFSLADQPATLLMHEFLKTGILPATSNGTLVSVYAPGSAQPKFENPYEVPTGALAGDLDSGSAGNITVGTFLP